MNDIFSRALKIALRTGDKVIVIDQTQEKPYVMMNLDDYEKLLNGNSASVRNRTEECNFHTPLVQSMEAGFVPLQNEFNGAMAEKTNLASPEIIEMKKIKKVDESDNTALEEEEYFYMEPVKKK